MRILIVDDSKLNLQIAKDTIISNRITENIITCESGEEALDILSSEEIDIILLDIVMPGINGLKVLEIIRSKKEYSSMQIIMLTSINESNVLKKSFELGANDYINKPFDDVELTSRIKAAYRVKEYQKMLKETMSKLEKQNKELKIMTAKIKEAQFHLIQKEKLASLGRLIGGVAHEMNNPVGYITSNFETLQHYVSIINKLLNNYRRLYKCIEAKNSNNNGPCTEDRINCINKEILEDEEKYKLDYIISDLPLLIDDSRAGLDRISGIVRTLLEFAKSDDEESFVYTDLNQILREVILLAKNDFKNIELVFTQGDVTQIFCNRVKIAQAILNIIHNAVYAIQEKGVEAGKIGIATFLEDEFEVCTIEDNGIGIDKAIIKNIFDPFYTTRDVGMGVGIGLTVSYDIIVNKHNGILIAESEIGKGSIFTIKLPLMRDDNA
ncbi:MAG: response regulator [Bacillota bacterium]